MNQISIIKCCGGGAFLLGGGETKLLFIVRTGTGVAV